MDLPLTPEEERIIRYADAITLNSPFDGKLNNECLDPFGEFWRDTPSVLPPALRQIRDEIIALKPNNDDGTTVHLDITKKYMQDGFDNVRNHLLNNGYIDEPDFTRKWILNERGKDMKRLKGHINYQRYEDKKHKAELAELDGKIHWFRRAVIGAFIGFVVGIGISILAIELGLPTPLRNQPQEVPQPHQPTILDSNH